MSNDDKYYVPVRAEDECLNTVIDKVTEVLGQNFRLESIFQKYNKDYNTTFTESVSVKTLQVRNQNHKPMFSQITATGMIRSPFSSNVSFKKDAKEQYRRQLKKSRLGLSTERKRLSFDEPDDLVRTNASQYTWINGEKLISNSSQSNSTPHTVITDEEMTVSHLDQNETFFNFWEESEIFNNPYNYNLENFNPLRKPETVTSHSVYEQDNANSVDKTPDKHQPNVIIADDNSRTNLSWNIGESRRSNLGNSPNFCLKTAATASSGLNTKRNGIFSLDEALGAIISLQLEEKDTKCVSTKTYNEPQTLVTSREKTKTHFKKSFLERSRADSTISPLRFSSEEHVRNSNQLNGSNQESLTSVQKPEVASTAYPEFKKVDELDISSSISNEYKATLSTSDNSIVDKTVVKATSNEQKFLNPKEDDSMPYNPKLNKRKSVDLSEESKMHTLASEVKKFVLPAKIAKFNFGLQNDDKTTIASTEFSAMAEKGALNPTDHSSLDGKFAFNSPRDSSVHKMSFNLADDTAINDKESFNSVDPTAINDKELFNPVDDTAINDKELFNPVDDTTMDDKESVISVDDNAMDTKESFNPVDDTAVDKESVIPVDDIAMDTKESLTLVDDTAMDKKESFTAVEDTLIDKSSYPVIEPSAEVSSNRDNEFSMNEMTRNTTDTHVINFASFAEKSERKMNVSTHYHDTKILVRNISSEKDQNETNSPHKVPNVQSSSNPTQDFSPSLKRTFDGRTQKLITDKSDNGKTSSSKQHCIKEKLSETTPPKPESIYHTKKDEFCKLVIQTKNRMFNYRNLFLEDKCDVQFICSYLKQISRIVEIVSEMQYEAELVETVYVLADKALKLLAYATLWESEVLTDLVVCNDCCKKVTEIQQELEQIDIDNSSDLSVEDFERWEIRLRVVNKKASDAMLLRDVRRPTILQFGYKIEIVIQFFIKCLLILGLIKPYSEVSFN